MAEFSNSSCFKYTFPETGNWPFSPLFVLSYLEKQWFVPMSLQLAEVKETALVWITILASPALLSCWNISAWALTSSLIGFKCTFPFYTNSFFLCKIKTFPHTQPSPDPDPDSSINWPSNEPNPPIREIAPLWFVGYHIKGKIRQQGQEKHTKYDLECVYTYFLQLEHRHWTKSVVFESLEVRVKMEK